MHDSDRLPAVPIPCRYAGNISTWTPVNCGFGTAKTVFFFPSLGQSMPFSDKRILTDCDIYEYYSPRRSFPLALTTEHVL